MKNTVKNMHSAYLGFMALVSAKASANPFDKMGGAASEASESVISNVAPIFVVGLLVMLVLRYLNVIGNKVLVGALVCLVLFGVVPVGVDWYLSTIK